MKNASGVANTPLGVIDEADYSRFETKLANDDMMLCVSDAFTESRDSAGNLLGSEELIRIVEQLDPAEPAKIISRLVERLSTQREGNLSQDDATALLFQADGSKVALRDNFAAPFRLLGPVRGNTTVQT